MRAEIKMKITLGFVCTYFGIVFPMNLRNKLAKPEVARNTKMRL